MLIVYPPTHCIHAHFTAKAIISLQRLRYFLGISALLHKDLVSMESFCTLSHPNFLILLVFVFGLVWFVAFFFLMAFNFQLVFAESKVQFL